MIYVDVDVFCKLAHWNILPILPDLTGFKWCDIAAITSLICRVKRSIARPDGKLFHTTEAATLASVYLHQTAPLPEPNPTILAELSNSKQIDSGEAVLLALTSEDQNGYFLTGDKRALRALSGHQDAGLFTGKMIMLEQILLLCLRKKGRSWLLENVCPFKQIDTSTSIVLGSKCDNSIKSIEEGLYSYINEINILHDPSLISPSFIDV